MHPYNIKGGGVCFLVSKIFSPEKENQSLTLTFLTDWVFEWCFVFGIYSLEMGCQQKRKNKNRSKTGISRKKQKQISETCPNFRALLVSLTNVFFVFLRCLSLTNKHPKALLLRIIRIVPWLIIIIKAIKASFFFFWK